MNQELPTETPAPAEGENPATDANTPVSPPPAPAEEETSLAKPPSIVAKGVFSGLLISIISVFPVLFLYLQNVNEMGFSSIAAVLLCFWGTGLALFGLAFVFLRSAPKAAVVGSVLMLVFQNYMPLQALLQKPFSGLKYIQLLPILLVVLLHLAYLFYRKTSPLAGFRITQLLCIGFAAVLLVTTAMAVPTLVTKAQASPQTDAMAPPAAVSGETQPNIYYLFFDEYSRNDVLEKYLSYDNSAFTRSLEEKGFTVSYTSENEYSSTSVVTANLVELEYLSRDEDLEEARAARREKGRLHSLLKEYGYESAGVGESDYFGFASATQDAATQAAATEAGVTGAELLWQRTPLAPFMYRDVGQTRKDRIFSAFDYFKDPANYASSNRFTMLYLTLPHQPFIFDAEGNFVDPTNWENWDDGQYYLNQLIYTNTLINTLVDNILANDSDSIIIIQSDHSARGLLINPEAGETVPMEDRRKFFNAVYYQGEAFDAEGLSGVNTLRAVFSQLLGADLPPIEVPQDEFKTGPNYRN